MIPKFSDIEEGSRLTPERAEKLRIGSDITEQEKDLFLMMLFNREVALAWDFSHLGKVKPEVAPPQKIETIEHKAWQSPGFVYLKALSLIIIRMLKE